MCPGNTPTNSVSEASYGSLDYYQEKFNSDTSWVWLEAARDLADKAIENFSRILKADYATTLGISAEDTEHDEIMIAEVEAECHELHDKIVRDLQTQRNTDVNRVRGLEGGYMSPVLALFKIATCQTTDPFLDIATLEGDLSFKSLARSSVDGPFDKYSFNIDKPDDRQLAIRAIMSEQDSTLYASTVRT
jgi:hypothetical protein